jgi:hypothetical protein
MPTHLRTLTSSAATILMLAGCATTAPAPTAQNAPCPTTGSRLAAAGPNCMTPGHSYSSDQISSTGATTTGGALQILDPSLTVHH